MKWPFSKKDIESKEQKANERTDDRVSSVFFETIAEKRKEDPLIGAKVGSKDIFNRLISVMQDSKGVHIESFICALGSLAGYSCQAGLRREFIEGKDLSENEVFAIIDCKDGSRYYFGDKVNKPLVEDQYSVWSLAAGIVQHLGAKELIDIRELFEHVTKTVGSDSFGIPRIPEGHKPGDIPVNYVKHLWPAFLPVVESYCPPCEWPILYGMAVQEAIGMGKDAIDPVFALSIAMESAVPMAKADIKLK